MKKKIIKIVSVVVAIILFAGICFFVNALTGNPISRHVATNTAEKHLEEKYGDTDFKIEQILYDFKDSYYHAFIVSPSSADSHFSLLIDMWGKLCADSYEDNVLTGWNTSRRISDEYEAKVDSVFYSPTFPYNENIGFGEIVFVSREYLSKEACYDKLYYIYTE